MLIFPLDELVPYFAYSGTLILCFCSRSSGWFVPYPWRAPSGLAAIQFLTNNEYQFSGFTAHYCSNSMCPDGCSNQGFCYYGQCICEAGWNGTNCDSTSTNFHDLRSVVWKIRFHFIRKRPIGSFPSEMEPNFPYHDWVIR